MKKIFIAALLFICAVSVNAQSESGKSNAIKVNLFSPLVKTGSFFYERKLNENSSAQLGVGFTAYNQDNVKITGVFFTPEYRFYLSNEALNGFYVGPYVRYQNLKIEDTQTYSGTNTKDEATLSTIGGGLVVGREWLFKDIITLDIFAGPSYNSGKVKVTSGSDPDVPGTFEGFGARFGVTLGVAF